ncbi:MAG TPA: hypothetical protein VGD80_35690, partial [Kofleriaceae bacterium]
MAEVPDFLEQSAQEVGLEPESGVAVRGAEAEHDSVERQELNPTPRRGSGPPATACKSVVTMRFTRSGQRWLESGLAPCLSLRALYLSERLRPCFAN